MTTKLPYFKTYDIRGIFPEQLDGDAAYRIGIAFAEWSKAAEVIVGPGRAAIITIADRVADSRSVRCRTCGPRYRSCDHTDAQLRASPSCNAMA